KLIRVLGDMYFGMIRSVLNGKKNRGMVNFKSAPISLMSKKGSLGLFLYFEPDFEAPIAPIADSSKVSAPLKIFLIIKLGFNEKPIVWILLVEASVLKPKLNFFKGVSLMVSVSVLLAFSV